MMGSPESEEGRLDNEIQHPVTLTKGFWMSCCPVTQADYQAVIGSNPSRFIGVDRPVEQVTWEEAVEFCCKLTLKQRREGLLPERWEWRLPTEAEWEYAARAGTTAARHGESDAISWHFGKSDFETHAVGGKQANTWGLYDMLGNVSEWCSDWEGDYPTVSVTNPLGPVSGTRRVRRGGSWLNRARSIRSAKRGRSTPDFRYHGTGFRSVLSSIR